MKKIFGLYCPYHKSDIMDIHDEGFNELPSYPVEFRRVRIYEDKLSQMEAYANTHCPASQMFECNEDEIDTKVKELDAKFSDENWLEKNIYPYV